jgi:hypothetical protein
VCSTSGVATVVMQYTPTKVMSSSSAPTLRPSRICGPMLMPSAVPFLAAPAASAALPAAPPSPLLRPGQDTSAVRRSRRSLPSLLAAAAAAALQGEAGADDSR